MPSTTLAMSDAAEDEDVCSTEGLVCPAVAPVLPDIYLSNAWLKAVYMCLGSALLSMMRVFRSACAEECVFMGMCACMYMIHSVTLSVVIHKHTHTRIHTQTYTQHTHAYTTHTHNTHTPRSASSARFVSGAFDKGFVDAAIWVSPLCTSRATKFPAVCTPMFKAAACFPYCMAARLRGSGADGLVLYNAPDWHERVHLMKRDCIVDTPVLANAVQSKLAQYLPNGTMYPTDRLPQAETIVDTDVVAGASATASKWDANTMGCVQSNVARTIFSQLTVNLLTTRRANSRSARSGPYS
jgi:hypothetical protein